jgi:hypothetical protein
VRRLAPVFPVVALLLAGVAAACSLIATPARGAGVPPFADADYWAFADRVMGGLDAQWDARDGMYRARGVASTRENSMLLLTHAIAAYVGHRGPTRQDARARRLALALTRAPGWLGAHRTQTKTRSTCWSLHLDEAVRTHRSLEPKTAVALAWAWRARRQLHLSRTPAHRVRTTVDRCARSRAWRYPAALLNQINWNADMDAADAAVTGDPELLVRDYRLHLERFARAIRMPAPGDRAPNLGPGYAFHYRPDEAPTAPINSDAPEYASIVVQALGAYDEALREGMRPLPEPLMVPLRAWVLRLLAGSWTHAGYLNWDTGYGGARWNSAQYWAFAQQGLEAIASAPRFWLDPAEGAWAKASSTGRCCCTSGGPMPRARPSRRCACGACGRARSSTNASARG